jgi:hypothetical protein
MHDNIGRRDQRAITSRRCWKGKIRERMRPKFKPKTR